MRIVIASVALRDQTAVDVDHLYATAGGHVGRSRGRRADGDASGNVGGSAISRGGIGRRKLAASFGGRRPHSSSASPDDR